MKVKILSITFLLITGSLAFYMQFANEMFVKDKENYVFESALSKAKGIASQLYGAINTSNGALISIAVLNSQNQELARRLLNQDPHLLYFSIYTRADKQWKKQKSLTNSKLLKGLIDQEDLKDFDQIENSISKALPAKDIKERMAFSVTHHGNNFLGLLLKDVQTNEFYYGVTYYPQVFDQVKQDHLYKNVILDANGNNLFGKTEKSDKALLDRVKKLYFAQGTHRFSNDGENKLISFVKDQSLGLTILSIANAKKVFGIVNLIIQKGIYFGIFVLGLALAAGVLLSITVTSPIRKLLIHTEFLGKGDFSKKVDIKTNDEFLTLGHSFNWMGSSIGKLLSDLEDLNKNLEKKVEERTRELKEAYSFMDTMINSLDQGLVVVDREQMCQDIFTKASNQIYGKSPKDANFFDLINHNEEKQKEYNAKWIHSIFEELLPFDRIAELGPKVIQTGANFHDPSFKHINLEYFPMRDDNNKLQYIVAVATDQTANVKAMESFKEKKAQVEQIIKIVDNKSGYLNFLKEIGNLITSLQNSIQTDATPQFNHYLMQLHSIKGLCGIYNFIKLHNEVHRVETLFIEKQHLEFNTIKVELANEINLLIQCFKSEIENVKELIGKFLFSSQGKKEIKISSINSFFKAIEKVGNDQLLSLFYNLFVKTPAQELFKPYETLISSLALRLAKKVSPLQFSGDEISLMANRYEEFINSLVHLFRNCMEHGIESPEKRIESGKDEDGKISVTFKINPQEKLPIHITISDDGAGINPQKIRDKMQELQMPGHDTLADEQVIYQIFEPQFSTSEDVNEVSGRGIGMSAIQDAVSKLGGEVIVTSTIGQGSIFQFKLPEF